MYILCVQLDKEPILQGHPYDWTRKWSWKKENMSYIMILKVASCIQFKKEPVLQGATLMIILENGLERKKIHFSIR